MFICKRCLVYFKQKSNLINHLNRKNICMPIESDMLPSELIKELNEKGEEKVQCTKCNNIYKNKNSLRMHNCKGFNSINDLEGLKKELEAKFEAKLEMVKNELKKEIENNPKTVNNTINNTLNVSLNCFMDTSGKPIEYLLNNNVLKEKILEWIKPKGIFKYIDEKFYNPEHPENQMIKKGKDGNNIQLHIKGKWKPYENIKASDLILTNVGNDFMIYMDIVKEDDEEYKQNRKPLKRFEGEVMRPLEWGIEISEDSSNMITKTIVINEEGEYVYLEDELENDKKLEILNKVIKHIQEKEV